VRWAKFGAKHKPGLQQYCEADEDETTRDQGSGQGSAQCLDQRIGEQIRVEWQPADTECAYGNERCARQAGQAVAQHESPAVRHGLDPTGAR
jgi:hypothetical protein